MSLTKCDKLIIVAILILSIIIYVLFNLNIFTSGAEMVEIRVNSKLYASYKLSEISDEITVNINTEYGDNTLKLSKKAVWMTGSSCADKLDVKCGAISKPNQTIICVPNKVSVTIKGSQKNSIDKVTY